MEPYSWIYTTINTYIYINIAANRKYYSCSDYCDKTVEELAEEHMLITLCSSENCVLIFTLCILQNIMAIK